MLKFIKQSTTGIVTTFGKFSRLTPPGITFYVPFAQKINIVSNRTHQIDLKLNILTKDKAFADIYMAVLYGVKSEDSAKALFSLDDPTKQISSYVENSIRSHAPKTELAQLLESFEDISTRVEFDLKDRMSQHGFTLEKILMTNIEPAKEVKDAINRVSSSERNKDAARNEAEAEYIRRVRDAEADRDRKILHGEGVAGQRKAILEGYRENIDNMTQSTGMSPTQIMNFILKSQNLDTMEQIGKSNNAKVLFVNNQHQSVKQDMMEATEASRDGSTIPCNIDLESLYKKS